MISPCVEAFAPTPESRLGSRLPKGILPCSACVSQVWPQWPRWDCCAAVRHFTISPGFTINLAPGRLSAAISCRKHRARHRFVMRPALALVCLHCQRLRQWPLPPRKMVSPSSRFRLAWCRNPNNHPSRCPILPEPDPQGRTAFALLLATEQSTRICLQGLRLGPAIFAPRPRRARSAPGE
jgi:hypothetical protein